MAPLPQLSEPGTAQYQSSTMTVGDGTWDFTKNVFLLPNLVGLDFDTMRYNGMGNRFSTDKRYQELVTAHGVLAAFAFLILVPLGVFIARFYHHHPSRIVRYHGRAQASAGLFLLAAFVLGILAVGPDRKLSNPHHGIGVAIFVLFILQLFGGLLVRHITHLISLRIKIHQWSGRLIALLGIVQIPLGLTLYGSPLYLFILYTLWVAFLVLLYFIHDHRREKRDDRAMIQSRRRRDSRDPDGSEYVREKREGAETGFIRTVLTGVGIYAIWKLLSRKKDRSPSPRPSQSRSRNRNDRYSAGRSSRSRSRLPEVVSSRQSFDRADEISTRVVDRSQRRGMLGWIIPVAAAVGLGKLFSDRSNRRERDRRTDDGYSEVATGTPNRRRSGQIQADLAHSVSRSQLTYPPTEQNSRVRGAIGPPGDRSSWRARTPAPLYRRPNTPTESLPSHALADTAPRRSYNETTSGREEQSRPKQHRGAEILTTLGMGWLAKRFFDKDRQQRVEDGRNMQKDEEGEADDDDDDEELQEEEQRRRLGLSPARLNPPRFTGDGMERYPSRRRTPRYGTSLPRIPGSQTVTTMSPATTVLPVPVGGAAGLRPPNMNFASPIPSTILSDRPSTIEPPTGRPGYAGPPMPPLPAERRTAVEVPVSGTYRQEQDERGDRVRMPDMPADPHGVLYDDNSSHSSLHRLQDERGRTDEDVRRGKTRAVPIVAGVAGAAAAAAAVAAAAATTAAATTPTPSTRPRPVSPAATDEEAGRLVDSERATQSPAKPPMHIRMHVHDDRDRNVTFRRMTTEEVEGRNRNRNRSHSMSSSDGGGPGNRRGYRRSSASRRRMESEAERIVTRDPDVPAPTPTLTPSPPYQASPPQPPPLPPPAGGRGPDSTYFSGYPAGLSRPGTGLPPGSPASPQQDRMSPSVISPAESAAVGSSALSSAERRRSRRRVERRLGGPVVVPPLGRRDLY